MNQVQQFLDYLLNAVKIFVIVQPWQTGLRVRKGKKIKKLEGGVYFKYLISIASTSKRTASA